MFPQCRIQHNVCPFFSYDLRAAGQENPADLRVPAERRPVQRGPAGLSVRGAGRDADARVVGPAGGLRPPPITRKAGEEDLRRRMK